MAVAIAVLIFVQAGIDCVDRIRKHAEQYEILTTFGKLSTYKCLRHAIILKIEHVFSVHFVTL